MWTSTHLKARLPRFFHIYFLFLGSMKASGLLAALLVISTLHASNSATHYLQPEEIIERITRGLEDPDYSLLNFRKFPDVIERIGNSISDMINPIMKSDFMSSDLIVAAGFFLLKLFGLVNTGSQVPDQFQQFNRVSNGIESRSGESQKDTVERLQQLENDVRASLVQGQAY